MTHRRPDDSMDDRRERDARHLALHDRMLAGDVTAQSDVFTEFYGALARFAESRLFRDAISDRDDVAMNLTLDLLAKYIERPQMYQPDRGKSLLNYFFMGIAGDVNNYLKSRHYADKESGQARVVPFSSLQGSGSEDDDAGDVVENLISRRNGPSTDGDPVASLDAQTRRELIAKTREQVTQTDEERIVFDLQYVHGEKTTGVFVQRLGIGSLPSNQQTSYVQAIKDRLSKRLKRLRETIHE